METKQSTHKQLFYDILTREKIVITLSGEMVNIVIINSVSITHER